MILFFDLEDYINGKVIGCENVDSSSLPDMWDNINITASATKDSLIEGVTQYILSVREAIPSSACTAYSGAYQTITGITTDSRYTDFWDLAINNMEGLTPEIWSNYNEGINDVMCSLREIMYYFDGDTFTTFWEYPDDYKAITEISCCSLGCEGDCVTLSGLVTTDLIEIDSVEEFNKTIYSELIDVKNRQTISSYATLKLLYDRYNYDSLDFSSYRSSQFDYFDMDNFGKSVGGYWVDLMEQVIPATSIWESTYTYRNTVFDQQKYAYKRNGLYRKNPSDDFPFSAIGTDNNVEVIITQVTNSDEIDTSPPFAYGRSGNWSGPDDYVTGTKWYPPGYWNGIWTMQWTCSPEFLGKVQGDPESKSQSGIIRVY